MKYLPNILNVSLTSWLRPQANKLHWHFLESGDSFYFFFMCFGANQKVLFVLLFSCLPGESKAHFPGTRAFSHSGTSETADAMKDAHTLFFKRMFFRSRLNVLFPLDRRFLAENILVLFLNYSLWHFRSRIYWGYDWIMIVSAGFFVLSASFAL